MYSEFNFTKSPERHQTGSLKWQKYAGRDILPMWVADMDFVSPEPIREALRSWVEHGVYGYTIPYTSVEDAVIEYFESVQQTKIEREWLVWMPGLVPALNAASRAFGAAGEGILTNTPVYPPFLTAPEWQGKSLQAVPLKWDDERFIFDFEAMEAAVTEQTRLFVLCNPHNPVGRAWSRSELEQLVSFCQRHELLVVSDEIHCDLILSKDCTHQTFLGLGEWAHEHSLTLMAPSKTYNVPGLACSFIVVPNSRLRAQFQRAARGLITEVNCMGYAACEAAYRFCEPWRQALIDVLRSNYAILARRVAEEMPRIQLFPLEATYLAWMDVRALGQSDPVAFFESFGVGLSDGAAFGSPGYVRFNFGTTEENVQRALDRMVTACQSLE
jgi:cystathionine beta-lyase